MKQQMLVKYHQVNQEAAICKFPNWNIRLKWSKVKMHKIRWLRIKDKIKDFKVNIINNIDR